MDLKSLCKAVLFHFSTKGTTVHHFVLIIPLLFFKALSHMYLYRGNILRYIFLKFFVFREKFFFYSTFMFWVSPILKIAICALTFFLPQYCQRLICFISFFKEMFVFADYCIFTFLFHYFSYLYFYLSINVFYYNYTFIFL